MSWNWRIEANAKGTGQIQRAACMAGHGGAEGEDRGQLAWQDM